MPTVLTTERFSRWFENLRDGKARTKIQVRIDRMEDGQWGDFKTVGGKVFEARIHFGPGYRIYFTTQDYELVILLAGGDKSSQNQNIEEAIREAKLLRNEK